MGSFVRNFQIGFDPDYELIKNTRGGGTPLIGGTESHIIHPFSPYMEKLSLNNHHVW